MMKMTALAEMLLATAEKYGDREVTLMEEGTGEIRFVAGISFDTSGDSPILLEHLSFQERELAMFLDSASEDEEDPIYEYDDDCGFDPFMGQYTDDC
jgi:hypothetical protein